MQGKNIARQEDHPTAVMTFEQRTLTNQQKSVYISLECLQEVTNRVSGGLALFSALWYRLNRQVILYV